MKLVLKQYPNIELKELYINMCIVKVWEDGYVIESYVFGRMRIYGVTYTSDLIVFPDCIKSDWWRIEGHKLRVEDLEEVLRAKPEILVVGTGYYGLMKVLPETEKQLRAEGIRLITEKTEEAYKIYNKLSESNRVTGAFHSPADNLSTKSTRLYSSFL